MTAYLRFEERPKDIDLMHFGVLGMHWGVWNADTRARYMGGGKRVATKDVGGKKIPIANDADYRRLMKAAANAERRKQGDGFHLSDKQKTALKIAAGAAAVAVVAGVSIYAISKNPRVMEAMAREIDPSGLAKKAKTMSPAEDLAKVNYGVGLQPGRTSNCVLCSTAYDLRRRGFDVKAGKSTTGFVSKTFFDKYYTKPGGLDTGRITSDTSAYDALRSSMKADFQKKIGDRKLWTFEESIQFDDMVKAAAKKQGLNFTTKPSAKDVEKALIAQGEGARGAIGVTWSGWGGGHSIAYEVRGGKLHFPDGQIGKEHDLEKLLGRISERRGIEYVRLDNATPNLKMLADDKMVMSTSNVPQLEDLGRKVVEPLLNATDPRKRSWN